MPSIYGPGRHFDELQDHLRDMGAPAPQWGRKPGRHGVWLATYLPTGYTEVEGESLDEAARNMIITCLTSGDQERDAATAALI